MNKAIMILFSTLVLSNELAQELLQELTEAGLHGQRASQIIMKLQNEAQHQPPSPTCPEPKPQEPAK